MPNVVGRRKAFTLVELLVVIGIIAVLVSILLPTLSKVRNQAKTTACASNLRQVGMAAMMYVKDNKGQYPMWGTRLNGAWSSLYLGGPYWDEYLYPYISGKKSPGASALAKQKDTTVFLCPQVPVNGATHQGNSGITDERYFNFRSYVANVAVMGFVNNNTVPTPLRLPAVKRPTEVVLFADGDTGFPLGGPDGPYGLWVRTWEDLTPIHMKKLLDGTYTDAWNPGGKPRSVGITNIVFCDGHVEGKEYKKLAKLDPIKDVYLNPAAVP